MLFHSENKLDNPVWNSLNETHEPFALSFDHLKCYHPDICPFGGYIDETDISKQLDNYSTKIGDFFIVGNKPEFSGNLVLSNELICQQMIIENKIDFDIAEDIINLNQDFQEETLELINLVQPGYFKTKTMLLGNYYGIFKNNKLIAITGERMKMNEFTEVSAIVTHPNHTGKSYAKQLIAYTLNKIFDQNKIPYLHVTNTNSLAINLYQKLGFRTRGSISFWNFKR